MTLFLFFLTLFGTILMILLALLFLGNRLLVDFGLAILNRDATNEMFRILKTSLFQKKKRISLNLPLKTKLNISRFKNI